MTFSREKEALYAHLERDRHATLILDFDHTLFLDNSTERYLDAMRPRLFAFLIVAAVDWMLHLLHWCGLCRLNEQRDYVRVRVCDALMPWNRALWERAAPKLARNRMSPSLLSACTEERRIIILSHGFEHVIAPLLAEAGLSHATLIASCTRSPRTNLRLQGKTQALESALPHQEWEGAVFVTDSMDDADVLNAVPGSYLIPREKAGTPAFRNLYVPLRYATEGKYPGTRYFTQQIMLEDMALLWLAYAFSWRYATALCWLFLSLYTLYEVGYHENDHIAALKERNPRVSDKAGAFSRFPRVMPWLWALFFAIAGLTALYAGQGEAFFPAFTRGLILWVLLLVAMRIIFRVFNLLPPLARVPVFPMLHGFKTFSFALFVPLSLPGALLLGAQVVSLSVNYCLYRLAGNHARFNRQLARLVCFLATVTGMAVFQPGALTGFSPARWTVALIWAAVRSLEQARRMNILRILAELFSSARRTR